MTDQLVDLVTFTKLKELDKTHPISIYTNKKLNDLKFIMVDENKEEMCLYWSKRQAYLSGSVYLRSLIDLMEL